MWYVRALSAEDGWAIVENDAGLFLLRPPYTDGPLSVDFSILSKAGSAGFEISEDGQMYGNLDHLCAYLNSRVRAARQYDFKAAVGSAAEKILRFAPPTVLTQISERIRNELIERGRIGEAERAIATLAGLPNVRSDNRLQLLILDLLRDLQRVRDARRALIDERANIERQYPALLNRATANEVLTFMADMRRRRSLFNFAPKAAA